MTSLDQRIVQSLHAGFDRAIDPQLTQLERPGGYLEAVGRAEIGRPQGYLLGVCESLVEQHGLDLGTTPYFAEIAGYVFWRVYGQAGEAVGLASFEAMRAGELAILQGQRAGRQDMAALAAGTPGGPAGFYALATTDGQARPAG